MLRPRSGLRSELIPTTIVLACLAGTPFVLLESLKARRARSIEKTAPVETPKPPTSSIKQQPPTPTPTLVAEPEPEPPPVRPDSGIAKLRELASAEAVERREAAKADASAAALERSSDAAIAEAERWTRRDALIKSQIESLEARAGIGERELALLGIERDVLSAKRSALREEFRVASERPAHAVLPHKGPNGTWRRPVVIECVNGTAKIQPNGPTFSLFQLMADSGFRSHPFVEEISKESMRIQRGASPDGARVVPYLLFIVRPDGIRPYYLARSRVERIGIAFGYELADQDWRIDFPNLDDPSTWDGSSPAAVSNDTLARLEASEGSRNEFIWKSEAAKSAGPNGGGGGSVAELARSGGAGVGEESGRAGSGSSPADERRSMLRGPSAEVASGPSAWDRVLGAEADQAIRGGVGLPARRAFSPYGLGSGTGRGAGNSASGVGGEESGSGSVGSLEGSDVTAGGEGVAGVGADGGSGNGEADGQFSPAPALKPLEIVITCGAQGVAIHPGGLRVTAKTLKAGQRLLESQIEAVLLRERARYPDSEIQPRLRFLIAPGGHDVFWTARSRLALGGYDWPVEIQVSQTDVVPSFSWDRF